LFSYAKRSIRHDSHYKFIVVAASLHNNGQILRIRTNRMRPPLGVWGSYGDHAEQRLLTREATNVIVARFNVPDLKENRFRPLCARPCAGCQACIKTAKPSKVWYVDWSGNVVLL
jgi:hypothetical protein